MGVLFLTESGQVLQASYEVIILLHPSSIQREQNFALAGIEPGPLNSGSLVLIARPERYAMSKFLIIL